MVRKIVTGKCPCTNNLKSIRVDLQEINICGDMNTHYRKMSFLCDDIEECSYRDEDSECPIFLSVKEG